MQEEQQQTEQESRVNEMFRRQLGHQLRDLLAADDVIEIMLNPDGTLWVERLDGAQVKSGTMLPAQAEAIMTTLASMQNQTITRDNPELSCELPDGSRFQGLIAPITARPTFVIRKHATRIYTLEDYVASGAMTADQMAVIKLAADTDKNILVVGPTGSGKTTLLNAIIHYFSEAHRNDRLFILEDTREIQSASPNIVPMKTTATIGFDKLLFYALRMKPRRILLGEVREPKAAQRLLIAWNTGHSGGLCTVHANDASAGLLRIESLAQEAMEGPISKPSVAASVNFVVSIKNTPRGRRITEILSVHGHDGARYITTKEG